MTQVTRVRLGYNNVYVVQGASGRIAVDAGPDYAGAWEAILDAGAAAETVLVTHGHLDHAGLARKWQGAGARVVLGTEDARLAGGGQLQDEVEFAGFVSYVESIGAPAEVTAEAVAGLHERRAWAKAAATGESYPAAGRGGRWATGLRYEPFAPDILVEGDGEVGGLRYLACPGHTPGNMVAVAEREGWLFSGDQLLPDMTPTPAIQFAGGERFRSLPAFAASLRRLEGRASRCYPGHGEPFDDVDGAVRRNLEAIEQRSERVLASLREEGPAATWGLAERVYPRAARRRFWQIVATIQGQLDVLEEEGRVTAMGNVYEAV